MAEVRGYACDVCHATLTPGQDAACWVEVRGFVPTSGQPAHLCSPPCLLVWAQQRASRRPAVAVLGPGATGWRD